MDNKLQKRESSALKERSQYLLTFGVVATLLIVAGFPVVVVFFFGVFAYFLWKTFSQPATHGVKEVFEFYLAANEILRDDERRWFGFEVKEAIFRGESILQAMHGAPPLVYFSLGALYNKMGDHEAAANHLAYVLENENADEATYIHPSGDLRAYVRMLRKLEREPKEAPKTSAAVRSLERFRRNSGTALLAASRDKLKTDDKKQLGPEAHAASRDGHSRRSAARPGETLESKARGRAPIPNPKTGRPGKRPGWRATRGEDDRDDVFSERKPITEVLHDIYDKNIQ